MTPQKQIKKFDAQIDKVLDLMANSIYTNKEIFLRELISNASDACDKLRYAFVAHRHLNKCLISNFFIQIRYSTKSKEFIVEDNGIGMNYKDLVDNVGTIASSGTQRFFHNTSDKNSQCNFIGEFGVGFYSVFMVASSVSIYTRKVGESQVYKWFSDGKHNYSIEKSSMSLNRGTRVVLVLKDNALEFLNDYRIKHIVNKYSEHISIPIELLAHTNKKEIINKVSAVWLRDISSISKTDYHNFFHHLSHSSNAPWVVLHNRMEGSIEYINLLFIPSSKTSGFEVNKDSKIKLYANRVFINESKDLLPSYLRFITGIVDSYDLSLNISREIPQHNKILSKIKSSLTKKILNVLKIKSLNDTKEYQNFWQNFKDILKEGLCDYSNDNKINLIDICKFYSTYSSSLISVTEYISRMHKSQKDIFYLISDNSNYIRHHPQLEGFVNRGIEVLLLTDHIDNFWVNTVREYKNIKFSSITNSNIDLDSYNDQSNKSSNVNKHQKLTQFIKTILKNKVKDVIISSKLVNSAACLSNTEGNVTFKMEKLLMHKNHHYKKGEKILEINPCHRIFDKISKSLNSGTFDNIIDITLVEIVYDLSLLMEGESLDSPDVFSKKINLLFEKFFI